MRIEELELPVKVYSVNKLSKTVPNTFIVRGTFKFPQYALKIHKLISSHFKETYFVGGAVRNILLKKKITDIDIATSATPKHIMHILDQAGIKYLNTNEKLGVIVAQLSGHKIEITTFRTETYSKGRFPKVAFIKSPKVDSKRRDLTINALYYSPELKQVLDFHRGLRDIENKTVRFIGDPDKRIKEDPLRIVRAHRFALQYNLKFEGKTALALQQSAHLLKNISATRVQREINVVQQKNLQKILQKVIHSMA